MDSGALRVRSGAEADFAERCNRLAARTGGAHPNKVPMQVVSSSLHTSPYIPCSKRRQRFCARLKWRPRLKEGWSELQSTGGFLALHRVALKQETRDCTAFKLCCASMRSKPHTAPLGVIGLAKELKSEKAKRLVRGLFGRRLGAVYASDFDKIFSASGGGDFKKVGEIAGQFTDPAYPKFLQGHPTTSSALFCMPNLRELRWKNELDFQVGRISANSANIKAHAAALKELNSVILESDVGRAVDLLRKIVAEFGFSAAAIRKLSLIHAIDRDNEEARSAIGALLSEEGSRVAASYFYMSDAIMSDSNSYIETAKYWAGLAKTEKYNSSRMVFLNTLWPVVPHPALFGWYLRALGNSSLIDVFFCIRSHRTAVCQADIDGEFGAKLASIELPQIPQCGKDLLFSVRSPLLAAGADLASSDWLIYRRSSAFLEESSIANWRYALDYELLPRLVNFHTVASTSAEKKSKPSHYFGGSLKLKQLASKASGTALQLDRYENAQAGSFLRSVAVLSAIAAGDKLDELPIYKLTLLLEATESLSTLLTEQEILRLYLSARAKGEHLATFLALVMLNEKNPSPDNKFDLFEAFQSLVVDWFSGDMFGLLDWVHAKAPELVATIVDVLDEEFLTNLYMIFDSYQAVLEARQGICEWAYTKTGHSTFEIMANRIRTDLQVAEVSKTIDSSRIYVAQADFKKWAEVQVSPVLERYKQLKITHSDVESFLPSKSVEDVEDIHEFAADSGPLFYLVLAANLAFTEFCRNPVWGISAYLSRRIRHGTLVGHLEKPVWERIEEFKASCKSCPPDQTALVDSFFAVYRDRIADLRDERIQFATQHHISGLFSLNPLGDQSRRLWLIGFLRVLSEQLQVGVPPSQTSGNFFDYCWGVLSTDLPRVQHFIQDLRRAIVHEDLANTLGKARNASELIRTLETDLGNIISERFEEFQTWFVKPDAVASTASLSDLVRAAERYITSYSK